MKRPLFLFFVVSAACDSRGMGGGWSASSGAGEASAAEAKRREKASVKAAVKAIGRLDEAAATYVVDVSSKRGRRAIVDRALARTAKLKAKERERAIATLVAIPDEWPRAKERRQRLRGILVAIAQTDFAAKRIEAFKSRCQEAEVLGGSKVAWCALARKRLAEREDRARFKDALALLAKGEAVLFVEIASRVEQRQRVAKLWTKALRHAKSVEKTAPEAAFIIANGYPPTLKETSKARKLAEALRPIVKLKPPPPLQLAEYPKAPVVPGPQTATATAPAAAPLSSRFIEDPVAQVSLTFICILLAMGGVALVQRVRALRTGPSADKLSTPSASIRPREKTFAASSAVARSISTRTPSPARAVERRTIRSAGGTTRRAPSTAATRAPPHDGHAGITTDPFCQSPQIGSRNKEGQTLSTNAKATTADSSERPEQNAPKSHAPALMELDGFKFFSQIHRPLLDHIRERNEEGLYMAASREDVSSYFPRFTSAAPSPAFLTIGASDRCTLKVPDGDPGVSARHLLVRYRASDAREDDVTVFFVDDGTPGSAPQRRLPALRAHCRRFAVRVSGTEILFLPVRRRAWRVSAAETWEKLECGCLYLDCHACRGVHGASEAPRGLLPIDALTWPAPKAGLAAVLRIKGERSGVSRVLGVPRDADGVVIGRRGLAALGHTHPSVSQPHLVIVRDSAAEKPRYFAVDLGSQYGSLINGWGFEQVPLEANARIELGDAIELTWEVVGADDAPGKRSVDEAE